VDEAATPDFPTPPPSDAPAPVARPQVGPGERIAAAAEVVLCSGFPTQLLLIVFLVALGFPLRTDDGHLSPPFVFLLSLLDTVLVIALVWAFLRLRGESARAVLIGARPVLREMLIGVALMPLLFVSVLVILLLILSVAPQLHNVPKNPLEDLLRTRGDAIVFAFVVMVAGGVREEVQRGFILHRFDQFLGGAAAGVIVFSVFFGLGHLEQGFDAAIATGTLGAFWGVVYVRRRSIVAPMVSHAGFNLAQLAKYFVVA
jgi:membrane protease YdiL (CAAX protease family)